MTARRKLYKTFIVFLLCITVFAAYVEMANRNSNNMTYRQKILRTVYPAFMWLTKITGKNTNTLSGNKQPPVSFYSLKGIMNNGEALDFSVLKGKKVMLVNTASNCGYTNQYADLQQLADKYKENLVVLGFPANDFKEQEKGTDEEIAQFCKLNYGLTFPLMKKSSVMKGPGQNPVYQWLTDTGKNGWNRKLPSWNFSKYLINEEGVLIHYFGPSVSPLSEEIKKAINR